MSTTTTTARRGGLTAGNPPDAGRAGIGTPRIAVIRQAYRVDGGAERFVAGLASTLGGQNVQVTVITRRWDGAGQQDVITCDPPKPTRVIRDWGFARGVRRILRSHRFDLVQSNERIPGCHLYRAGDGVHREWLRQRARTQSLPARLATALSPYHAWVRYAERAMFESPEMRAVICNGQMVRDEILEWFDIEPEKLHIIHTGVDTDYFHPRCRETGEDTRRGLGVSNDTPLFAFIGSGFARKGLDAAIRAIAAVPEAHLIVVGQNNHTARFRRLSRSLGAAERLHFTGILSDVLPVYGAADALLLPTLYDPFPNVTLEAMACGLPVVTSTKCGAAEIIRNGENGWVSDALDVHEFTRALRTLCDSDRCRSIGDEARRTAECFTLDVMRERLLDLYNRLLTDHGH